MIKLLIAGIWVCVVTLGAVYFSVDMATAPEKPADDANRPALELVRGETLTIPVFSSDGVKGYFLGRISFQMDKAKMAGQDLPMKELMTDELFTLLVGNKMVDLSNTSAFDLQGFRDHLKTDLNARLGQPLIQEVLVEQLDYLSKEDIAANSEAGQERKPPLKIAEGVTIDGAQSSGH
ncbi:hypothetical protein [Rhizobium halophytocola]|uniref:Flagellar basal body-associated FliL family protein n=1 Tax=Rhizobium halophytocola TaxID=735519 RepID=A0ABS4E5E7_9HYPH|nr:hypothetical protein [Rhizobium halophytocola]MBP1853147.1 hypothetical protein [Rhizobium halophytocola]